MNEMTFKRNELLAQQVIKGLVSRNMSGYYAASREEALKLALLLIPEGSTVTMGGAMSAHEIGLPKALTEGNYNFLRIELDKVNGIDLDTIVAATDVINPIIDRLDLIDDSYILDIVSKEKGDN